MLIKDIMTKNVVCATPDDTVFTVAKRMQKHKIGAIPVCNAGKLKGMITDRDIVTRVVAKGVDPTATTARQIMTTKPVWSRETETIEDAVHLMEAKHIRRLPVMDTKEKLVGMFSLDDVGTHASHELSGEALEALSFARKTVPVPTARI